MNDRVSVEGAYRNTLKDRAKRNGDRGQPCLTLQVTRKDAIILSGIQREL